MKKEKKMKASKNKNSNFSKIMKKLSKKKNKAYSHSEMLILTSKNIELSMIINYKYFKKKKCHLLTI